MYDPGSNVSLIQKSTLDKINKKISNKDPYTFNTISGAEKQEGIINVKMKIHKIEELTRFFVINKDRFKYDMLLGLDAIHLFKLAQDHKSNIYQYSEELDIYENVSSKFPVQPSSNIEINFNEGLPIEKFQAKFNHLSRFQRQEIENILSDYSSIFAKDRYDVGTVNNHVAQIRLTEDRYIAKKPYRSSFKDLEEIEKQVKALLKSKLIEESTSPFAAPVTLAYKKESEGEEKVKERLCVDFRELNKIILPENYPFPLIDDLFLKTQGCRWFTSLDINSAFWSIPIRIEDRHITGFVTQSGHYQFRCLPFGLKSCSSIFQRILGGIIQKYKLSNFCINYLDDILIFSESFEKHVEHIRLLMKAIQDEGFKLKLVKCSFAQHNATYLGHVIENDTIRPLMDNLKAIKNFPVPKTQRNIRQFLGKVNFYLKFIPDSTKLLEPFHHLLRKNVRFEWDENCEENFKKVKNYLTSKPTLAIFNRHAAINIYTDASLEGMGAILKQIQIDGSEKPVAYFSKKFTDSQKRKKAIYLECIAIREAVKFWQFWLLGNKFTVYTDHKPLENLNITVRTDQELGDLTHYLSQYNFEIKYRSGKQNAEADCLSRNPINDTMSFKDILQTTNNLTLEEIRGQQKEITNYDEHRIKTEMKNDIKYKRNTERIILSQNLGKTLLERVHQNFGHIGSSCMLQTIKKNYYFRNMETMVREYCRKCHICIKNKTRPPERLGTLGFLGPATKPWDIMSLDTIGGFGGRRSNKKYIHLLIDHFTRFAFILTSATQAASNFKKLITKVQEENDTKMKILLTDQQGGFTSSDFQKFIKDEGIDMILTATDCAFSNGTNERLNQTLVNRIRCKINENERNKKKAWTTIAHYCVDEYNNTVHSTTGFAPSYLLYGTSRAIVPKELNFSRNLQQDRETALRNTLKTHEQNEKRYNKTRKEVILNVNDQVFVEVGNKLNQTKLDEIRLGPYKISNIISKHIVEVELNDRSKKKVHVSKIVTI